MNQYKKVFDGDLGNLLRQLHQEVDTSVKLVQEPVQETLIKELVYMAKSGVIKKVDEPTELISPLVIAKKQMVG